MFVDNLKRFHANVTRRRVCLAIFTSRRKTGTYGALLPACRLRPGRGGTVNHSFAASVRTAIYD